MLHKAIQLWILLQTKHQMIIIQHQAMITQHWTLVTQHRTLVTQHRIMITHWTVATQHRIMITELRVIVQIPILPITPILKSTTVVMKSQNRQAGPIRKLVVWIFHKKNLFGLILWLSRSKSTGKYNWLEIESMKIGSKSL